MKVAKVYNEEGAYIESWTYPPQGMQREGHVYYYQLIGEDETARHYVKREWCCRAQNQKA